MSEVRIELEVFKCSHSFRIFLWLVQNIKMSGPLTKSNKKYIRPISDENSDFELYTQGSAHQSVGTIN